MFENDVKTYGTQAESDDHRVRSRFENDVKTYGTQAAEEIAAAVIKFENDVKTYGTQANAKDRRNTAGLRMM